MTAIATTPGGVRCEIVETTKLVGDAGWRWGRTRAVRFAGRMNAKRIAPSHRFAVQALGLGRWRVIALQNVLLPVASADFMDANVSTIDAWLKQGRTDPWIAHQLEVSVAELDAFRESRELPPTNPPWEPES